ncbi:MAG: DUF3253 domain-containing protein [Hyphomicrobiaceae bacterium]|nr:DUF3253 domain-containing protein [Hyphomicrobiaceae bacterium]
MAEPERIEEMIVRLCEARGPHKSICPSEVARALVPDEAGWRALMPEVRAAACRLQEQGVVDVLQRGQVVSEPRTAVGPIRLCKRRGAATPSP